MKVALVHDFLIEYGGAERVLESLHEIYPSAPVYTAFYNPKSLGVHADKFKGWDIRTSWGQKWLPLWQKLVSPYRVFSKSFFESFDFSGFDVVISSSNAYMSKAVRVPGGVHICYCHTPPRFLYGYPTAFDWQRNVIFRILGTLINHFMRVWDYEAAQEVDWFIANSKEVQARIKKFYRRDSVVIYPPVDVKQLQKVTKKNVSEKYFLVVSRLVGAKNVDLAVKVCKNLKLKLKVVGTGREMGRLKELAGGSDLVEFLGDVSDVELTQLYANARAVIFPASQEDFGLVPVEAMAVGVPVIALAEGGVKETVVDGKTGLLVEDLAPGAFVIALNRFIEMEKKHDWDRDFIQKHAEKFSKEKFKGEIHTFVVSRTKSSS